MSTETDKIPSSIPDLLFQALLDTLAGLHAKTSAGEVDQDQFINSVLTLIGGGMRSEREACAAIVDVPEGVAVEHVVRKSRENLAAQIRARQGYLALQTALSIKLPDEARESEREGCALLCEKIAAAMERDPTCDPGQSEGALCCAEVIRQRGTK